MATRNGSAPIQLHPEHARLENDKLVLTHFEERDGEVLTLVGHADDALEASHRAIQVGARALNGAQPHIDTGAVDRSFRQMADHFDGTLERTNGQIDGALAELFDNDQGQVTASLREFE